MPKISRHSYDIAEAAVRRDHTKGQLISKCLFGVIVWTKNQRKNYQNFCPSLYRTEILVIFTLVFCPNDDTKKTF